MSSSGFDQLVDPPVTLRAQLIKVILGALAPVIVFSAALIILFARQGQATLTRGLQETTRALGTAVEKRNLSQALRRCNLASSEALDTGQVSDSAASPGGCCAPRKIGRRSRSLTGAALKYLTIATAYRARRNRPRKFGSLRTPAASLGR